MVFNGNGDSPMVKEPQLVALSFNATCQILLYKKGEGFERAEVSKPQ